MMRTDFAEFCKEHRIAAEQIKWRVRSDKAVKISIARSDFAQDGGLALLSTAILCALREIGVDDLDIVVRLSGDEVDIVVER